MSSLAARPLLWLVRAYQLLISPLLPQTCRYYPSCSAYGVTSLQRFGLVRGTYLMLHRIVRCNPWSAGGVDHVPQTWAQRGSDELTRPQHLQPAPPDLPDTRGTNDERRKSFS